MNPRRRLSSLPQIIPTVVLEQLRAHLGSLPTSTARMLDLLLECGMRVSNLCALPFDCLVCDSTGNWFLRYIEIKRQSERVLALAGELVTMIRAQQQAVVQEQRGAANWLFPGSKGRSFSPHTFLAQLNRLAFAKGIRDDAGNVWRFQALQFPHTAAARKIRERAHLEVIGRLLGHRSLHMTQTYPYLPEERLREDFKRFRR